MSLILNLLFMMLLTFEVSHQCYLLSIKQVTWRKYHASSRTSSGCIKRKQKTIKIFYHKLVLFSRCLFGFICASQQHELKYIILFLDEVTWELKTNRQQKQLCWLKDWDWPMKNNWIYLPSSCGPYVYIALSCPFYDWNVTACFKYLYLISWTRSSSTRGEAVT